MSYLLSIELRRGDSVSRDVGEIVLLDQAWCESATDVLVEYLVPNGLTGSRFLEAIGRAFEHGLRHASDSNIAADPRLKGVVEKQR